MSLPWFIQDFPEDFALHLFTLIVLSIVCVPASLTVVLHIIMSVKLTITF